MAESLGNGGLPIISLLPESQQKLITWNSAREGFTSLGLLRSGSTHGTFRKISILETMCQKSFEASVGFFLGGVLFVSFSFVLL